MPFSRNEPTRVGRGRPAEAGFTLLEFLVAFTLLTVVLASLLAALFVAVRGDSQAAFVTLASSLARSKLAAAGVDFPLRPGVTSAAFENGYVWQAVVRPYGTIDIGSGRRIDGFWIEVTIADPRSNGRRSLSLSSLEIVPRPRSARLETSPAEAHALALLEGPP
jgi:type II secretory pathway pseudopilin PulG